MACTTLVRGPRKPVRSSSSIGEQPCSSRRLGQLASLLGGVDVADEAVLVGVAGDRLQPVGRHRADAVGGHADAHPVDAGGPLAQRVHPFQERLHRRVAEADLPGRGRLAGARRGDRRRGAA